MSSPERVTLDRDAAPVARVSASFRHPAEPARIAAARRQVRAALARALDETTLAQVSLLVSELVTNAVRHARTSWFGVEVDLTPRRLRVAVADGGRGFAGEVAPDLERAGGYGLHLVDAVADRWAVELHGAASVWFELDGRRLQRV